MHSFIARGMVSLSLRLHNFSYRCLSLFSPALEPDKLHPKHRLMNYHQWFVRQLEPHWRVLDVGSGNGALTADLASHCHEVIGIEESEKSVKEARARYPKIRFIMGDATQTLLSEHFDAVVLSNILEHIEDRQTFLKNIAQMADRLLIRVPMMNRDWVTLYKKERGVEWRLHAGHFTEYTQQSLTEELASAGLSVAHFDIMFGEIYVVAVKAGIRSLAQQDAYKTT